jgi:hypothetical protein
MNEELFRFLGKLQPIARERATWGAMKLRVDVYLTTELPPSSYVTSVRAVLFVDTGCALLHNVDDCHVLPGGRRESNESLSETLARELMEETACVIRRSRVRRPGRARPVPDPRLPTPARDCGAGSTHLRRNAGLMPSSNRQTLRA